MRNARPSPPANGTQKVPDLRLGHLIVQFKTGSQSLRGIRNALLALAYQVAQRPSDRALLVITGSNITLPRLESEMDQLREVLRPELARRLSLSLEQDGHLLGLPRNLEPEIAERIRQSIPRTAPVSRRKPASYTVLEFLVHEWLLGHGPMTTERIMEACGASYPTVAASLRQFEHLLERSSDRRVQLRHFPQAEWAELVAVSARIRSTTNFTDRSGTPRSVDSLLRRLAKLRPANVAVGGTIGAHHYLPSIDIIGAPRLDLSMHRSAVDRGLVEALDPALERTTQKSERVVLAVHLVSRHEPLFVEGRGGLAYADPVECLLDLHEARLEPQARELLEHFQAARRK
jgi:hypothetical protein